MSYYSFVIVSRRVHTMKFKKGFTLAEILIVLMVIGVIAALTIPSLMRGVAEAQYKAGYKKAYNAIVNIVAKENLSGNIAKKRNEALGLMFFGIIYDNISVKELVKSNDIDSGIVVIPGEAVSGLKFNSGGHSVSLGINAAEDGIAPGVDTLSSWIVADDGLAYAVLLTGSSDEDCPLRSEILAKSSAEEALKASCSVVVVDVNGLYKGPNRLERQVTSAGTSDAKADSVPNKDTKMNTLTRDRYYIYVGADGATAGPADVTVSGRIVNDLK